MVRLTVVNDSIEVQIQVVCVMWATYHAPPRSFFGSPNSGILFSWMSCEVKGYLSLKLTRKKVRFINRHDFHQKHTRYIERTGRAVSVQNFLHILLGCTHLRDTLVGASHSIWSSLVWNGPLTHYELANGSQRGGLRSTMVVAFLSVHSALRRLLTLTLCRVCALKFIFAPELSS